MTLRGSFGSPAPEERGRQTRGMLEARSLRKAVVPASLFRDPSPGNIQSTRLALNVRKIRETLILSPSLPSWFPFRLREVSFLCYLGQWWRLFLLRIHRFRLPRLQDRGIMGCCLYGWPRVLVSKDHFCNGVNSFWCLLACSVCLCCCIDRIHCLCLIVSVQACIDRIHC